MTAFRRLTILIAIVLASVYGFAVLHGPQGIPALIEKHREIQRMETGNAALRQELAARQERNRKLKEGTEIQEQEIRKRLHLLRPGETQFVLPDKPPATNPSK
jgi:cell division protein FtsB